jgi:hypothetical protein
MGTAVGSATGTPTIIGASVEYADVLRVSRARVTTGSDTHAQQQTRGICDQNFEL